MEYHAPGSYSYRKETALMLTVRNLHKIYGKYHALSGLDMNVGDGALYGFVGPNGAGKTTTLKIMTGLLGAEEGSVTINGKDALRYSNRSIRLFIDSFYFLGDFFQC